MNLDVTKPFPQVVHNEGKIGHLYKFTTLEELQGAMANLVTIANGQSGKVEWTILPSYDAKGDPLKQVGYVGITFQSIS